MANNNGDMNEKEGYRRLTQVIVEISGILVFKVIYMIWGNQER